MSIDGNWFRAKMKERQVTQQKLGKRLGIGHEQISRMLKGARRLRIDEVDIVADALGCSPREVLKRAGLSEIDELAEGHVRLSGVIDSSGIVAFSDMEDLVPAPPDARADEVVALVADTAGTPMAEFDRWVLYATKRPSIDVAERLCLVTIKGEEDRPVIAWVYRSLRRGEYSIKTIAGERRNYLKIHSTKPTVWIRTP